MTIWHKRLALMGLIVLLGGVALFIGRGHEPALQHWIGSFRDYRDALFELRHLGPYAFVVFFILMAVVTVMPGAPTSAVALVIGACLGHWLGFIVNALGLTVGNLAQAGLFQYYGKHRQAPNSRLYQALIHLRHPAWGLMIGYAVPLIPTAFVNMAASATEMTPRAHALACLTGSTIVAFIYAFFADLLVWAEAWRTLLLVLAVALMVGLLEYGLHLRRTPGS